MSLAEDAQNGRAELRLALETRRRSGPRSLVEAAQLRREAERLRDMMEGPVEPAQHGGGEQKLTSADVIKLLRMVRDGWTYHAIGEQLGVASVTVRYHARKAGEPSRANGRALTDAELAKARKAMAKGATLGTEAARLGVTRATLSKWLRRTA